RATVRGPDGARELRLPVAPSRHGELDECRSRLRIERPPHLAPASTAGRTLARAGTCAFRRRPDERAPPPPRLAARWRCLSRPDVTPAFMLLPPNERRQSASPEHPPNRALMWSALRARA